MDDLQLVSDYASREGTSYDEALEVLLEEARGHDSADNFLGEIGMGRQHYNDARRLMREC